MITIDGSQGEGGGQIVRSSIALSMVTGVGVCLENIRAGRNKPGLLRQHLTAVRAAAEICRADAQNVVLGASNLVFHPEQVTAGDYQFSVGTAGSATLVLQTVLPALMLADGPSSLVLEGGTHNPWAPTFDFLQRAYLPLIARMGPRVEPTLMRHGFYPAGGGEIRVEIHPVERLRPLHVRQRGELLRCSASATVARLPRSISERELKVLGRKLDIAADDLHVTELTNEAGPGNVVTVDVHCEHAREVFTGFGQRGKRAEHVASETAREVKNYLRSGAPIGEHLADQLLLPLALAGEGSLLTMPLTSHSMTGIEVIRRILDVDIDVQTPDRLTRLVTVGSPPR